jgi:hypothetical protein
MSRAELWWFEQAISIVHRWEAGPLSRVLTTAEAGSLVQSIAHELEAAFDGQSGALADGDFLLEAYRVVDGWDRTEILWHLNAGEAAALAESIAQALGRIRGRKALWLARGTASRREHSIC